MENLSEMSSSMWLEEETVDFTSGEPAVEEIGDTSASTENSESLPVSDKGLDCEMGSGVHQEDCGSGQADCNSGQEDCGSDQEDEESGKEDHSGQEENESNQEDSKAEKEARKRAEHEAAEAKRKAEWEAARQAKKAAEQEQMNRLNAMTNEDVMMESMKRVSADTEKLTRRNMKDCVSEHIQTRCLDDPAFARLVMHPRKTMVHCFWYINRKAREFIEQEMKNNDIRPEGVNGVYGGDVPDDLCYQWAEDYFRDTNAEEDKEKEEKFVAKPFNGKAASASKTSKTGKVNNKKKEKQEVKGISDSEKKESMRDGQLSFLEQITLPGFESEVKAG